MTMKQVKVYMTGNERVGYTVRGRMNSKLIFESHYEEKRFAERFMNQLDGVRIVQDDSHNK